MAALSATAQTTRGSSAATIAPNDNLIAKGIPPIPADIAERAQRYTEFRAAAFVGWHPTRREMLISTRFGATAQIHQVAFPGADRSQLTFFADHVSIASYPRKRDDYFVFSKDAGGGEFYQTYRYDFANGASTLLTDGKSRNSLGVWSHDDKIAYTSTRRNGRDTDVYVMDPLHPQSDKMAAQCPGGGWSVQDWSPDSHSLLLSEYVSINESYLWLLDLNTSQRMLLVPRSQIGTPDTVAYEHARFRPDGKGFYVITDRDNEFGRLAYIDIATRQPTYLTTNLPWDVTDYDLSRDGAKIAFVSNEDGVSKLHLLDMSKPAKKSGPVEEPLPALPLGVIAGVQFRPDGSELAFSLNTARATNDAYSIMLRTKKLERWTRSETNGLLAEQFPAPELVHWKSFDGKIISGFLYRPPARFGGKRPVVINIHGGPEGQSLPRFLGQSNYYLNELGVAILFPNIRGSLGYGKTFVKLDNGFLREDSYKDIGTLLDWIPMQPGLDGGRIMVTGGSYGGHMTLAVATRYADRLRCALDIVGMSNLVTFLEHTEKYRQDLRRAEYGDEREPKMRAFLESIAPMNHVDKITKPLFVVQGKNDPRVPYTEAEQIVSAVGQKGTPVWYLLANDEGHGFVKKPNTDFLFYSTVAFMQQYLLNE